MVDYAEISLTLARAFVDNPANFVAEADLQYALARELHERLSPSSSTVRAPYLTNLSENSFKGEYSATVRDKLERSEAIDRVHTEVSVEQGERLDVAVFRPEIRSGIEWVSGGSKRFDDRDLEAAFELKFVKNKSSFPTVTGTRVADLDRLELSVDELVARSDTDDPILDLEENKLRSDVRELNRLENVDQRYLLLFSNRNYLYHDPGTAERADYRYGELYARLGAAARRRLRENASDSVGVLYAHPRGATWVSKPA